MQNRPRGSGLARADIAIVSGPASSSTPPFDMLQVARAYVLRVCWQYGGCAFSTHEIRILFSLNVGQDWILALDYTIPPSRP
jgi:hypothetical protein